MTRIRCRDRQCTFNKNGVCTAEEIEYEPDAGCLTMEPRDKVADEEREDWEDDKDDWEDADDWDEDEDDWEDDEDDDDEEEEEEIGSRSRKPGHR
ncbi:MAG: hypothetical protein HZC40_01895 [Chloroflexi bacterium]|jgi:hypothetical protein|nr:hypothetical protein [Chloroflexota bacterium]